MAHGRRSTTPTPGPPEDTADAGDREDPASPGHAGDAGSTAGRLADLEARVAHLETATGARLDAGPVPGSGPASGSPADPDLDPEAFWALAGLRSRAPDPGAVLLAGTVVVPSAGRAEWQEGFTVEALLETDWTLGADALAALGHPIRLVLLQEILRGVRTAADLAAMDDLGTTGQMYHHLRHLVAAGWLRSAGRGRYEIPAARVVPLLVIVGSTHP